MTDFPFGSLVVVENVVVVVAPDLAHLQLGLDERWVVAGELLHGRVIN